MDIAWRQQEVQVSLEGQSQNFMVSHNGVLAERDNFFLFFSKVPLSHLLANLLEEK